MIQPRYFEERPKPRIKNPRAARSATQNRIVKKSRQRYTTIVQLTLVLGVSLAVLMGYVVLTSSLTGLSYAVANAREQRDALAAESMRLDDKIAALRSDDRLAALAAKMGMHEPQRFALVRLPVPAVHDDKHVALLQSLAGFFEPAVAAVPRR